ncbi:cation:proton antiporter [Flavobacterium sp. SM2513]|uniref:cation:proton antiporter n=1 Tax=Flavobacterium sp. SM2513 TaxID=3424766 RepID=UPI003D7F6CDD
MELQDAVTFFETYNLNVFLLGLAILVATVLPRVLSKYPLSMPIVLLTIGYLIYLLPLGVEVPNPNIHGDLIEHITELAVIIAVMGAGLKISKRPSFKGWKITARLLGITMVLTIASAAVLGWYFAAFVPATALLLGAIVAPTDPVLASEIEEEGPGEDNQERSELKFALTSEAGLNDGLAFPFTHMAIAMAAYGLSYANWFQTWFLANVLYEIIVGVAIGIGLGYLLARFILNLPVESRFAKSLLGIGSFAATLIIYGFTEFFGGYGFIAVFCGAVMIRQYEPDHEYHVPMHSVIEKLQIISTAILLIGLGASISGGILDNLDISQVILAVLLVLIIRPLCGIIGLTGITNVPWKERLAISFLGIRGFGSIYYLAYAVNHQTFEGSDRLWSLIVLVIVLSVFIHGITASPILRYLKQN